MTRLLTFAAVLLAACVPSNVVAPADREVRIDPGAAPWQAATREQLDGLFASEEITGPLATGILKVFYLFQRDGAFTGAALIQGPERPEFRVLNGRWELREGRLSLGDGVEPALLDAAPGLLRLRGGDGIVVLRRLEQR